MSQRSHEGQPAPKVSGQPSSRTRDPWFARSIALPPIIRYALAVALAAVAVFVRLAFDPLWGVTLPYITLFPAIMASAWLGGRWPGILTTAITAAAAVYYWIEPAASWAVLNRSELVGLLVFIAVGVFISMLNEAWRRAIDDVAASEDRLAVTIQSIGDAVVATDDRGRVVRLNPIAEALTGWTRADAIGQLLTDVLVLLNEETRAPVANPVDRVLREGTIVGLANHTVLISKDGREIPIEDSAAPVRTENGRILGAVMVFRDVSERRRIERERDESERVSRELAFIVESSDDAIIGMALDGTITAWNPAAGRMYGFGADEMVGTTIRQIIPEDRWLEERNVLDRIGNGEFAERYETVRRHKDGSALPVSLSISPIRDHTGLVIGASKIARDITARRQIEVERAALLKREQEAREEIERASKLKDEFLAVLSHELRTPLNAVLGYAQLLSSASLPSDRAKHAIDAILRNAQAQTRLVESLLDLSRVAAGKLELDLRSRDLAAILESALEVVRPDAQAKGVDFEGFNAPVPVFVLGDATRLQQVFWNLFSNAVKFTPRGGRVSIRSRARDTMAVVEVTDNGAGIPTDFLPYMFDRFKQADGRTQSRAGLGLGLAVAREMVQAHGGTIVAESQGEGLGSTFRVTLPLATGAAEDESVTNAMTSETAELLAHLDILIVDDDDDARDLLALILESRGARTQSVASAAEALDVISRRRPSLLLSDLRMPIADGYSLIRQVRAEEDGRSRLPAIAVTANAGMTVRHQAIAAGYDLHVSKPVDAVALTRAIMELTKAHGV